ncbi:hypothetical protein BDY24DRAFT_239250 [Mrakia frigida]|uniref:uncharacterized protein n=1 Tax=Mrakia frigida TaxID=29902 RepID=UPI003FCC1E3C
MAVRREEIGIHPQDSHGQLQREGLHRQERPGHRRYLREREKPRERQLDERTKEDDEKAHQQCCQRPQLRDVPVLSRCHVQAGLREEKECQSARRGSSMRIDEMVGSPSSAISPSPSSSS